MALPNTNLVVGRVLPAAAGTFVETGQTATLRYSGGAISLLDQLTTAPAAAYGLRKLKSTYAGSAIRIRRSSDNTEQDIGFTGSNLNTASISSFVGSSDAYVTTLYDQSGNAKHLTQATNNSQPILVLAGTLQTQNSLPAIYSGDFGSRISSLSTAATALAIGGTAATMAMVATRGPARFSIENFCGFVSNGDADPYSSGSSASFISREDNNGDRIAAYRSGILLQSRTISDVLHTMLSRFDGANNNLSQDGVTPSTATSVLSFGASGALKIGAMHRVFYSEFIFWNVDLGSSDRSILQSDQQSYWGTP